MLGLGAQPSHVGLLRDRGGELRPRLCDVELADDSRAEARLHQPQLIREDADAVAQRRVLCVERADREVLGCDVGGERERHDAVVVLARSGGGGRRFEGTPHAAPEVDLVAQVEWNGDVGGGDRLPRSRSR